MKQINLKTNEFNKRNTTRKSSSSLVFGVALLVISLGLYGAVYFYGLQINDKAKAVDNEISLKESNLNSEVAKKVYDFEKRLVDLQSKINANTKQSENLVEIAKATFQETYFKDLESSVEAGRDDFIIDINVPDFDFLARQINAFNTMKNLNGDVNLEDSAVQEAGLDAKIKFSFISANGVNSDTE